MNILIGKMCGLDFEEINKLKNDIHFTDFEDVVFQKKFDVYTDNDLEARYLITPALMNKISDIENKFGARLQRIEFCWGNELLIFIESKEDSFELFSTDGKTDNINAGFKIYDEIISIYNLIDYIKKYLVYSVESHKELTLSEIGKMKDVYDKAFKAKLTISGVLNSLIRVFVVVHMIVACVFKMYRHSITKSDFIVKLLVILLIVDIIAVILAAFFMRLEHQLDKQIDRYNYLDKQADSFLIKYINDYKKNRPENNKNR